MHTIRLACSTVLTAALLIVAGAGPAGAHVEVSESDPPAAGEVGIGIEEIEIRFLSMDPDEPVAVVVVDSRGVDRVDGEVSVDRDLVTVPVQPLEAGEHRVEWTAFSTDGDGVSQGTYVFTVVDSGGTGFGLWLLWIVALGIPAAIFLRPGARKKKT